MNRAGFIIPIPQAISAIVAMFIAFIGIRIVMPIITPILNLNWNSSLAHTLTTISVYLVIVFIVYIIVYGYLTGRTPNILAEKRKGGSI